MCFIDKAQKIKLVILDVDGVLTDGRIVIGGSGEAVKFFNCRDGLGITLLHNAGIKTAIITGRESQIVCRRAQELKISEVYQGASDKRTAYAALKEKYRLDDEEIAYIGDDLLDLPVMVQSGLPCAVGDAAAEVKAVAAYVASAAGGQGAVRECAEMILKSQNKWQAIMDAYLHGSPLPKVQQ